jgi:hypothetical protein
MHPYGFLSPTARWVLLAVLVVASLSLAVVLANSARELRVGPAAPHGLLSYEFAWTHDRVRAILLAWGPDLKEVARAYLRADFAFLVTYPLLLSLACAMISDVPDVPQPAVGVFLSWAVLCAIPIEALENIGLLRMLGHGTHDLASDTVARAVGLCAGIKFTLGFAALGYLLLSELGLIADRLGLGKF